MKLPWSRPLALPPQLEWKYANEPELMSWTVKARNYNTFIANIMLLICLAMVIIGTSFAGDWFQENREKNIPVSIGFFLVMISVALSVTHQRMNFAYRFSKSGGEFCEWKNFPKAAVWVVNGFAVIAAIACVTLLGPDGMLLGVLGAGGMGLTAIAMINSKSFQKMHTTFHHNSYSWSEFPGVVIDQRQKLVGLKFRWYHKELKEEMVSVEALYTRSRDFNKLIDFLEKHLPDVPFTEGKVRRGP
ncbi:hypothetical protein [Pseudomonas aeruginosa]|uniref:hypothetical protein n=1 Tax=Pseudomonas aeruginosa TaxID=287 RepID=UPI000F539646|nr:hypothetical protein [Pseudomonas aeruginosa]